MKRTFQSFVLGCRVNEAERAYIDRKLIKAGYTIDTRSPQVIIIHTCAITGKAEREVRQLITQQRSNHPEAKIVITGCSATYWLQHTDSCINKADLTISNAQKGDLIAIMEAKWLFEARGKNSSENSPIDDKFRRSNRLLVKIQDGCHRFCSYCIVPYLWGKPRSTPIKQIVAYVNSFDTTPSEVIMSAINTESFGKDTGETLIDLISGMIEDTSVPRIGFGSIHPWSLNGDFLQYFEHKLLHEPRFLPFFHVPLQSCSNTVLSYMNRPYKIEDIEKALITLSKQSSEALIATDIIVGFLGETDELFEETYKKLKNLPINRIHVFRFSSRPHTAAADVLKKTLLEVSEKTKKERAHRLIELSNTKYGAFLTTLINVSFSALAIAYKTEEGTCILLNNQVEGYIPHKHVLPGTLLRVTIKSVKKGKVVCEMES